MGKIPDAPAEIFDAYTQSWKAIFGNDLVSIILYGSGARGDYQPGSSDLNFLVVLSEGGIRRLHAAYTLVDEWKKRSVAVPLIVTEEYIESSKDSFPVEFFNMKLYHQVVTGRDVLEGISINKEDLRLQCEREIKGKLLHLREAFFEMQQKRAAIRDLLKTSLHTFLAIFPALLHYLGHTVPAERKQILEQIVQSAELDASVFQQLWQVYSGESGIRTFSQGIVLWQNYIDEIRKLARFIDRLAGGA